MSGPHFERLISLEDEELATDRLNEEDNDQLGSFSYKVPMIPATGSPLPSLFRRDSYLEHSHKAKKTPGIHFTINGRNIHFSADQLKYLSLVTLTVQNAALNLTMRAARTQEEKFSTSVAVTVAEVLKLVTCLAVLWFEESSIHQAYSSIKTHILDDHMGTLKVAVPSFVYYIQNNLLYVGSTHLDAATSQVVYQLKILTTAIFSVFMLGKRLTKLQWISLLVLFVGVAMIEALAVKSSHSTGDSLTNDTLVNGQPPKSDSSHRVENPALGFLAILIACCLSGFAGVYFERILKSSNHVSLWIRNIQLSVLSIPFGLFQVFVAERDYLSTHGMFHGFTALTWLCIALQVQGGLLVALVVKYANNILKGFATSLAILISTLASMVLFNFTLTPTFILGASLVIGSVLMYNK